MVLFVASQCALWGVAFHCIDSTVWSIFAEISFTSLVRFGPLPLSRGSSVPLSSLPHDRQQKWQLKSPSTSSSSMDEDSLSNGEGKKIKLIKSLNYSSSENSC